MNYNKEQPESIQTMFDNIAKSYDRTNAALSFCMHHLWNASLVQNAVAPHSPKILADLCAGTGEIAFRSLKACPSLEKAHLIDFSQQMLECAKAKAEKAGFQGAALSYIQADAQQLPLENESVDCITMAYGIRNVLSPSKCIKEAFRTLAPGGVFGILELTEPENPLLKAGHKVYLRTFLPLLGKWLAADEAAYQYLQSSIRAFVKPRIIKEELLGAGFESAAIKPLAGGIASLIIAKKSSGPCR